MGLSEAIAQGDWVRALWSEVVLGLNLREGREQENVPPLISVTDSKGNHDHLHDETVGQSEDRRGAIDVAVIREDLSRPQMFLRWVDGKAQVADALTKLHGDGDLLRAVCRQAFTVSVEAPEVMAARCQENENGKGYRESSHHQSCGSLCSSAPFVGTMAAPIQRSRLHLLSPKSGLPPPLAAGRHVRSGNRSH